MSDLVRSGAVAADGVEDGIVAFVVAERKGWVGNGHVAVAASAR